MTFYASRGGIRFRRIENQGSVATGIVNKIARMTNLGVTGRLKAFPEPVGSITFPVALPRTLDAAHADGRILGRPGLYAKRGALGPTLADGAAAAAQDGAPHSPPQLLPHVADDLLRWTGERRGGNGPSAQTAAQANVGALVRPVPAQVAVDEHPQLECLRHLPVLGGAVHGAQAGGDVQTAFAQRLHDGGTYRLVVVVTSNQEHRGLAARTNA